MNADKYSTTLDNDHKVYEFFSEGPKGSIKKVIIYDEIEKDLFNLSFGDWDYKGQRIDDSVRTNNNDRDKVLATVASTVIDFMRYHPNATLFVTGSTAGRTRLYQISIGNNWREISQLFDIKGFYKESWEPFQRGRNYQGFALEPVKL